jgi:hypothetical protein
MKSMKFAVPVQWELAQFGDERYVLLVTHQGHCCMWRNSNLFVCFHSTKQSISIKDKGELGRTHLQVAPLFFVARMWKFTKKKTPDLDCIFFAAFGLHCSSHKPSEEIMSMFELSLWPKILLFTWTSWKANKPFDVYLCVSGVEL